LNTLDLGIIVNLSLSIRISEIATTAHQYMIQSFVSKDMNLLMRAFYFLRASNCWILLSGLVS